jgi:predicted nucleic acid-binding protein
MPIVIDTSAIIAVIIGEPERDALLEATSSNDLLAPLSVHWEVGNAFSAMFRRGRYSLDAARRALQSYRQIAIRFSDVELDHAVRIAHDLKIYAYDAYVIACALDHRCPLLSTDRGLARAAAKAGVKTLEIRS